MARGTLRLPLLLLTSADAGFTQPDRSDSSPFRPRQPERKRPSGISQIFRKGPAEGGRLFMGAAPTAFTSREHPRGGMSSNFCGLKVPTVGSQQEACSFTGENIFCAEANTVPLRSVATANQLSRRRIQSASSVKI